MDFKKIIILFVSCFLFSFNCKDNEEEKNVYNLGKIKLTFINGGECGCDESCLFETKDNTNYSFSIPTNFYRHHKIKVESNFDYDSLFIYQRESYRYALIVSETEGVVFFHGDSLDSHSKTEKKGSWKFRVLNKLNEFSISDNLESKTLPNMMPSLNKKRVELVLLKSRGYQEGESESEELRKRSHFGVFVSEIEIRLKYYIKGEIKRYTLTFPYRHGEC